MLLLCYAALLLTVAGLGQSADEDCKGCVPLDSHSFDKVIKKLYAIRILYSRLSIESIVILKNKNFLENSESMITIFVVQRR